MKLLNLIVFLLLLPFATMWGQELEDSVGCVVFVDSVPQGAAYANTHNNIRRSGLTQSLTTLYSRNRNISAVYDANSANVIHVSNVFKYGQTYLDIDMENTYGHSLKRIYLDSNTLGQLSANTRSYGQMPVSLLAELNGQPVEENLIIRDGDVVDFSIKTDDKVEKVDWLLRMEGKDGSSWEKVLEGDTDRCVITMSPNLFSANMEDYLFTETDPTTMDVYNKGLICAKVGTSGGYSYELVHPFSLSVLPKKPILSISNYREVYDIHYETIIPIVDAEIKAGNFETLYLEATASSLPRQLLIVFEKGEQEPYIVKDFEWGGLGCSYICWPVNRYGVMASDSVSSYSLATKIGQKEKYNYTFSTQGNAFTIRSVLPIQEIDIFGMSGKHLFHDQNINQAEVFLSSGMYLLRTKTQGKDETRKFIIK